MITWKIMFHSLKTLHTILQLHSFYPLVEDRISNKCTSTFTFRALGRRFYPKRLTKSTFVRRKRNSNISIEAMQSIGELWTSESCLYIKLHYMQSIWLWTSRYDASGDLNQYLLEYIIYDLTQCSVYTNLCTDVNMFLVYYLFCPICSFLPPLTPFYLPYVLRSSLVS